MQPMGIAPYHGIMRPGKPTRLLSPIIDVSTNHPCLPRTFKCTEVKYIFHTEWIFSCGDVKIDRLKLHREHVRYHSWIKTAISRFLSTGKWTMCLDDISVATVIDRPASIDIIPTGSENSLKVSAAPSKIQRLKTESIEWEFARNRDGSRYFQVQAADADWLFAGLLVGIVYWTDQLFRA